MKKIKIADKINTNKKQRINTPLEESLAKVWMEFNIPDLTKKVPLILNEKVVMDKIIIQEWNKFLFCKTMTVWINAVKQNHGINEIFSTGSQNQKPPHPNS